MKKGGTLFSYFKKVSSNEKPQNESSSAKPKAEESPAPSVEKKAAKVEQPDEEMELNSSNSSKENAPASRKVKKKKDSKTKPPKPKRRRIIVAEDSDEEPAEPSEEEDMDDSEDDFKPGSEESGSSDSESEVASDEMSDDASESEPESPVKNPRKGVKRNIRGAPKTPASKPVQKTLNGSCSTPPGKIYTPTVGNKTMSKLASFSAPDTPTATKDLAEGRSFPHLSLEFLKPENIRDAEKNRSDHPDYNPRTVHVPDTFLNQQTPAMRQWWVLKAQHFDTVLFFKMGKFYELFHMDATTGVKELGLIYMRGEHAHAGFPEIAFGRYADQLIQKGYKVARIEQTETPDGMNERVKHMGRKPTKFDKVVRREVCCVQTKGLQRGSFINGNSTDSSSRYLMAVCEKPTDKGGLIYGVCILESTIGKFYLGQFLDDRHSSRLRTVFSHYPPAHILYPRGQLSEQTQLTIKNSTLAVIQDSLRPEKEFWDGSKTLKFLAEADYFKPDDTKDPEWPDCLRKMMSETDSLGLTPADDYTLALSSLGAVVWYLMDSLVDEELLTIKNFEEYVPIDSQSTSADLDREQHAFDGKFMVLDGVTLANLDVVINGTNGTREGTLLDSIDKCITAFGKRLINHWLCSPLCSPPAINERLDAVEELMSTQELSADIAELLKKIPDLERALSRIHTMGSANRSKNHPEGRAIFFEDVIYSKRKIEDFLATLDGFKTANKIMKKCSNADFKSCMLKKLTSLESDGGKFPDVSEELNFFDNAFDHQKAKTKGVITPSEGVNEEYDKAIFDMKNLEKELESYRKEQMDIVGCKITYFGSAKNRYQMELPESHVRKVPDSYEVTSSRKGFKRFRTPEIEEMLASMMDAEDRRDAALKDTMRKVFHTFDKSYNKWMSGIQCLAVLDVLMSLATYSRCEEGVTCRPQFVLPSSTQQPFIELREARHPCFSKACASGDFIPNDTVIGAIDENNDSDEDNTDGKVVIVTGPNMGGKSTLMRQVGIVTIMAQLGCYVPAEKCVLTPVDRVFTRLGASDRIMAGESTFFVELSETSSILQHATSNSLVLMDELGRGTATYDGTAIASAVVQDLSTRIGCRTLFSTHYHSLVESFTHDPNVRLGHMACMVEDDAEDPSMETITFLYKFVKGMCPKSYGFNAARLASIPDEIIKIAVKKAKAFEANITNLKSFMKLSQIDCMDTAVVQELMSVKSS